MTLTLGIIFALAAMLCWGFGDFLIQKSVRKFGDWETLFFITLFGAIVLLPFVWNDLLEIFSSIDIRFIMLLVASTTLFLAALLEFQSLKIGKISVIEPLWSLEIPVAAVLAFILIKEFPNLQQILAIIFLIIGLVLVSLRSYHLSKHIWLEKGALLSILSAIVMGAANFFVGFGARLSNALVINWFFNVFILIITGVYLLYAGKLSKLIKDAKSSKGFLIGMCLLDNSAWVAFAFAMVLAPISIAVALSESYIIIAVLLGMFVSKEKLRKHQKIGLVIAILSAIVLAVISS
jgi:drug/metabolite transporter (DMT)-like permease